MIGGIINESKKITSDYTVVEADEIIYVDTTSGNVTLTLATPTNDNIVHIKKIAGSNDLIIATEVDGVENKKIVGSITIAYFIDGSSSKFRSVTDGRGYKVYIATLTQTGANAPVATVLENTLGVTPIWARVLAGSYYMTATGIFTEGRTTIFHNMVGATGLDRPMVYWEDVDTIYYEMYNTSTGSPSGDDAFYKNHTIEVRVYE